MKRTLVAATFFLVLLGLWQLATMSGRWSPVVAAAARNGC